MRKNIQTSFYVVFITLFSLILAGCGGGGGSGSQPSTQQGVFLDAVVQGLNYSSGSTSGVTDANGTFNFEPGKDVTFKVGDIVLGTAAAAPIITPASLAGVNSTTDPTVVNMVRFLLTIDDDNDPANGIQITDAVKAAAKAQLVNFKQSVVAFAADSNVINALANMTAAGKAGARALIDEAVAKQHFNDTVAGMMSNLAGNYSGSFSGDNSGTWSITVAADGTITGNGKSSVTGLSFAVSGQADITGKGAFGAGGSASFSGYFGLNGCFSGVWKDNASTDVGVFSGTKSGSSATGCSVYKAPAPNTGGGGVNTGGTVGGQLSFIGQTAEIGSGFTPVDQLIFNVGGRWMLSVGDRALTVPPGSEPPLIMAFVFNSSDVVIMVSVNKGVPTQPPYYEYVLDCTSSLTGCAGVVYNAGTGVISISNAVLTPTVDSGNKATGNLTISGSVSFSRN